MEKKYTKGIYFNQRIDNHPEWIIGKIAIKKAEFLEYLNSVEANEKGYVNIDVKLSKDGKPYCELNTYKSKQTKDKIVDLDDKDEVKVEDVPF